LLTSPSYYINYFNKTTTWEDPRLRYRQLAQPTPQHVPASVPETIPLQVCISVWRFLHVILIIFL